MSRLISFPWAWLVMFGLAPTVARSDEPKKADADPVKALIDLLPEVDRQDTGYSGSDSGSAFLPLGRNEWGGGLLSPRQGKYGSSDAMKSLVKLGVKAVPGLLDHLSDDRKTKIVIEHSGGIGMMGVDQDEGEKATEEFEAGKRYTVRVGDLCYVALGQIVNRRYAAVRYIPTAIISITCVPKSKELREGLKKEWGGLTADKHRNSLAKDLDSGDRSIREGAAVRLAYYHPDALEPLVLKQLARPAYDSYAVEDLLRNKLYPAKTAKERKELVEVYVKANGEIARDGIRWELFHDLPYRDKESKARECLIDVFGYADRVTHKDGPQVEPLSEWTQGMFIESLRYDRSEKIDRVVRDWLAKTDSDYMGFRCLSRLIGRGYDADIEAFIKRRLPLTEERYRESLKEYEAKFGWTWLHRAVDLDLPVLIETALKDTSGVNAQARNGRTALHLAAAADNLPAVERLLAAKADPNVKDGKGWLPVQLASHADHPEVVRRLVVGKSEVPDVFTAATVGDADRLAELLKADPAGVKARTDDGFTPLHVAAREGHDAAVRKLLDAGADVNAVDLADGAKESWGGITPLHLAVTTGKAGVAKLLLDHGAGVNTADKGKFTLLHYAAAGGFADVVKVLLAGKADREAKDEEGRTPLDLAKERKHAAVIKLLEASK